MFRVSADYDEVLQLQDEIKQLEAELRGVGSDRQKFDATSAHIRQLRGRVDELVEPAAEVGAELEMQAGKIAASAAERAAAPAAKAAESGGGQTPEEDLDEMLKKYADYTERRRQIEARFQADIEKMQAQNADERYKAQIQQAERQMKAELDQLNLEVLKNTEANSALLVSLMSDMSGKSVSDINAVLEKAQVLTDYIAAEKDEGGTASVKDEQGEITKTISRQEVLDLGFSEDELAALEKTPAKLSKIQDAVSKLNGTLGDKNPLKSFTDSLSQAFEKVTSGDKKEMAEGFAEIGKATEKFTPDVKKFGADLGTIFGNDDLADGINMVADVIMSLGNIAMGVSQVMSGNIIGGAIQIISGLASLFNKDKSLEKEIEKLQLKIDGLKWDFDNADAAQVDAAMGGTLKMYERLERQALSASVAMHGFFGVMKRVPEELANNKKVIGEIATAYGNLGYSVDKILGEKKYSRSREQLENLAQQQALVYAQMQKEDEKKKTDKKKMAGYKEQLKELGAQMESLVNELVEDIMGGSYDVIAKQLGDAFFEAFQKGENAAEAWGAKVSDIVANVIKQLLIQSFLTDPIADIFSDFKKKWFPNGDYIGTKGILGTMDELKDRLDGVQTIFADVVKNLPDDIIGMITGKVEDKTAATGGRGFETMTQETGSELNGRFSDIQNKVGGIQSLLMDALVRRDDESMAAIQSRDIAAETRMYIVESYLQLMQISDNTGAVIAPIRNISDKINKMNLKLQEL